jgi:alpha-ketoglutarate-dependent taurine dioxygenase
MDISDLYLLFTSNRIDTLNEKISNLSSEIYTQINNSYFLVLETPNCEKEQIKEFHFHVFKTLFDVVEQNSNKSKIIEVKQIDNRKLEHNYANSNVGFQFHTDGIYLEDAPEIIALSCIQPAIKGGESIIINGNLLLKELQKNQGFYQSILEKEYKIKQTESFKTNINIRKKIIELDKNQNLLKLNYFKGSIDEELTNNDIELLKYIDICSFKLINNTMIKLKKGDLLLVNNHKTLHGRNHFVQDNLNRHLLRFWGNRIVL